MMTRLSPGADFIVKCGPTATVEQVHQIRAAIEARFPDRRFVILAGNLDVVVLPRARPRRRIRLVAGL